MPDPKFYKRYKTGDEAWLVDTEGLSGVRFPWPPKVSGQTGANYEEAAPIGGASAHLDFGHTGNRVVNLEATYNRIHLAHARPNGKPLTPTEATQVILDHWSYFEAVMVPYELPDGFTGGEAPLLVLTVPGVVEMYCRLVSLSWDVIRKDPRGRIVHMVFRLQFKEDPQVRFTTQSILERGIVSRA